ncbi:exodeoxyribonuclease III [Candidatus Woesearchaeota archaeon]|nr:exodeoxyribonuclease III [Candidatus Woesearchaeota archaeon]
MQLISWNVNGLRAVEKKGFVDFVREYTPDILCLQETKAQEDQLSSQIKNIDGYTSYFSSAVKKGYSGTAIYTRHKPLRVIHNIGVEEIDNEGRVLAIELQDFFVVTTYVPNAQPELVRMDFRLKYEKEILKFLKKLEKEKPIILCGDLNVAHQEIDLTNPKANRGNPGFSDEEREAFTNLLNNGFTDTFRALHPEEIKYSWWSYRFSARAKNIGWRIDYFVVSESFMPKVIEADILNEIMGSDHCPVYLKIK